MLLKKNGELNMELQNCALILADVNITQGNCFDEIKKIEDNSIDLILTDPPYEISYRDGISKNPLSKLMNDEINSIDWNLFFSETYRVLKPKKTLFLHCRMDMVFRIRDAIIQSKFKFEHDFIWLKGDMGAGNLNIMGTTHELILCLSKGGAEKSQEVEINGELKKRTPSVYSGKLSVKENYGHPTQKPIGLLAYIIQSRTKPNDSVLDLFSGSGSTAVACKLLNRNFIGFELSQEFFELSQKRLKDEKHLSMYENMLMYGLTYSNMGVSYNKLI